MFLYKENRDLMRRDQIKTGRKEEKINIGATTSGGIHNTNTNNDINKNSLSSEGVKQTSVDNKKQQNDNSFEQITSIKTSNKKELPSYDVKIIGGKKVIIYHEHASDSLNLSSPSKRYVFVK